MNRYLILLLLSSILAASLLQGCGAVVVGGVAAGASVIHDRRSAGTILDDKNIQFKIISKVNEDQELLSNSRLAATSYNYVVLLTGQAKTAALRDQFVNIARNTPLVKRVVDEVEVGTPTSMAEETKDSYITSKVKIDLLNMDIPSFDPSRVKVITERNVVYLMGLVTQEEATAVVEKVRYIDGVKKVVKVFEYI